MELDSNQREPVDETFEEEVTIDEVAVDVEQLSLRARSALELAAVEAEKMGDPFVGTDHVLIALSLTEQCAARNVLDSVDLTTARICDSMRFIRGSQPNGTPSSDQLYSPRLQRVFAVAAKVAAKAAQPEIGTIHILSGLLREGGGLAVFLLESAGFSAKRADQVLDIAAREGWSD